MALDPATLKIIAEVAKKVATDEETRKRIFYIVAVPVVGVVLLLSSIHYMLTMPFETLSNFFTGNDHEIVSEMRLDNGYYVGEDYVVGDYGDYDAIDDEAFAKLMDEATKYVGRAYVWGGSTPLSGFDCSGFICWSYTKSEVYNLPRTTAQGIYDKCVKISRAEAKAGDLVFFHGTYESVGDVSHIGIYLGNGKMLHCGDPIGYADIDSKYWTSHFYGFGRLLTPKVVDSNLEN